MVEMNNIPFATKPLKAQYMWRDIERRTALCAIPWSAIPHCPLKHLKIPNSIALLGAREGWCQEYVNAAYRRWFIGGHNASMEPAISDTLAEIGQDAPRVIAWTSSDEGRDDRMDDAIKWCRQGTLEPAGET
jgi:2-hydroxychromene-2-carboxylate isomerase